MESQVEALYAATVTPIEAVKAQGDTIAARLQDIPAHVREVTGHGVHRGATVTLSMVQTLSGNDLQTLHPIFPEGEGREDFEELAEELDVVAGSISIEINKQTIVNMVFLVDD